MTSPCVLCQREGRERGRTIGRKCINRLAKRKREREARQKFEEMLKFK